MADPEQKTQLVDPPQRDARIRQANALAKSGQELDLNEKRLLLIAMARIKSSDTELLTHDIRMSELEAHLGTNPYARAERAARGLLRRLVFVPSENGGFREFQWTTVAEYVPASHSPYGESYVRIRLNEELAPLLLELKERYNTIPLLELLPMESFNGQRLYEILWHDSHGGKKPVITYDLQDLKFSLGMRTLEQKGNKKVWVEKYRDWRDFRKMLYRAQDDVQEHGRLRFSFEPLRQGRAIKQVRFSITLTMDPTQALTVSTPTEVTERTLTPEELQIADQLAKLGYLQDTQAVLRTYGPKVVAKAVQLGQNAQARAANTTKPISNLPGFIHHLLTSGAATRALTQPQFEKKSTHNEVRDLLAMIRTSFDSYRAEVAQELFESLPEETQESLPELIRIELASQRLDYRIELLDKENWTGPHYRIARDDYLLELYPDTVPAEALAISNFADSRQLLLNQSATVRKQVMSLLEDID